MSKTLKTIQTLHKLGKVLSKIIFVCCIIGAAGCLLGLILLPFLTHMVENFTQMLEFSSFLSIGSLYAAMSVGLVLCVAEAVLSKFAEKYFANEMKAGTPFTLAGAKELLRLGILTICISVGATIVAAIVYAILEAVLINVNPMEISNYSSVGMGIMFILGSLLCRLGAEQSQKQK